MSVITLVATLSDDVDLRFMTDGKAVCEFRLWEKEGKDEAAKFTNYNCKAFGTLAENIAASLSKGDRVVLHGRYRSEEWSTKEGEKRSKQVIYVDDLAPALRFATTIVERNPR